MAINFTNPIRTNIGGGDLNKLIRLIGKASERGFNYGGSRFNESNLNDLAGFSGFNPANQNFVKSLVQRLAPNPGNQGQGGQGAGGGQGGSGNNVTLPLKPKYDDPGNRGPGGGGNGPRQPQGPVNRPVHFGRNFDFLSQGEMDRLIQRIQAATRRGFSFTGKFQNPDLGRLIASGFGGNERFLNQILERLNPVTPDAFPEDGFNFGNFENALNEDQMGFFNRLLEEAFGRGFQGVRGNKIQRPDLKRLFRFGGFSPEDLARLGQFLGLPENQWKPRDTGGDDDDGPDYTVFDRVPPLDPDEKGGGGGGPLPDFIGGGNEGSHPTILGTALPPDLKDQLVDKLSELLMGNGLDPEYKLGLENKARQTFKLGERDAMRAARESAAARGMLDSGMTNRDLERINRSSEDQMFQALLGISNADLQQQNFNISAGLEGTADLGRLSLGEQELRLREELGRLGIDLDKARIELARELGVRELDISEMRLAMDRAMQEFLINLNLGESAFPFDFGDGGDVAGDIGRWLDNLLRDRNRFVNY